MAFCKIRVATSVRHNALTVCHNAITVGFQPFIVTGFSPTKLARQKKKRTAEKIPLYQSSDVDYLVFGGVLCEPVFYVLFSLFGFPCVRLSALYAALRLSEQTIRKVAVYRQKDISL